MDDIVELGGMVELSGFGQVEKINNTVINKIIGNYVKRFKHTNPSFEKLHLHLKPIHKNQETKKVELHGKMINGGQVLTSQITDHNLYFALDKVLKRLHAEVSR